MIIIIIINYVKVNGENGLRVQELMYEINKKAKLFR